MSAPNTVHPLPLCLPANVSSQDRAHPVFPSSLSPERPTGPASRSFLCKLRGIHEVSAATVVIRQRKAIATSLADDSMRSARFYFPRTKQNTRVSQSKLAQNVEKGEVRGKAAGNALFARWDAPAGVLHRFTGVSHRRGGRKFGSSNDATHSSSCSYKQRLCGHRTFLSTHLLLPTKIIHWRARQTQQSSLYTVEHTRVCWRMYVPRFRSTLFLYWWVLIVVPDFCGCA